MQIYDDKKQRIGTLTGFRERTIEKTLDSGDKTLTFEYPVNGELAHLLKEEYYIRTKEDEFVLKAVETGEQFNKYTAALNVEELEGQSFPYGFASQEQTIRACLEFAFDGTGWTVGTCTVTKKRTIDIEESTTAWDVLQSCLSTYRCECEIDSIKKQINIYEQIGSDRGCYFVEGLNLRKLTATSDTYEFYTRIVPIGKDGITIEWLIGKEYLENYQYSSKVKTYTWKDERYTNTTSLMEDAEAKLDELSKPYKVYSADVVDLAKANPEYKSILDYGIGDTVRMVSKHPRTQEKQRIVKIMEYPEDPEKNTVELSNTTKTFAEVQKTETELAKQEAISIANSTTQKTLKDNYYDKTEVESHITASEQRISLGVSQTYATQKSVEENYTSAVKAGQDAADAAEKAANDATDEKLTNYSTTEEMKSAIEMTEKSISLSVSQTYATQKSVEENYTSAVKAGQDAADAAEKAANDATDEKLTEYSTTEEMKAAIKVVAEEIEMKVSEDDVESIISQKADSIRLKADKIAWESEYSSMTEDGKLSCSSAEINGTFQTKQNYGGSYKLTRLNLGVLEGYYGETQTGLLDMSAVYKDGMRHASLKGFDYLHLQAGEKILVEQLTNFSQGIETTKVDASIFTGGTFTGNVTFEKDNNVDFEEPPRLYNLEHVSSGGHVVLAEDGMTMAYLASSSKRYKNHISYVENQDAEKILSIPVVWFEYKEGYLTKKDKMYKNPIPGFYAEDVAKQMKELARFDAEGKPEDWNYRTIIPLIVKMIQIHDEKLKGLSQ
jgi:phage minor structural protein